MKHANLMAALAAAAFFTLAGCGDNERDVGEFSNDFLGNEIMVEALADPEIPGVVCHLAYFDRSFLDRMRQGNWFENPSNSAVSCQRIGPIDLSRADLDRAGEEIFSQRQSLFFKRVAVRRIVDAQNRSIVYVSYSREIVEGSAKIAISSVALTPEEAAAARPRQ
ncbi:CreA family protein [Terricaulis sp.]|uniref:CreA family protein n=1 Tax=Terricaulis sp. TaxID=2768686 RepID=UPI0037838E9D